MMPCPLRQPGVRQWNNQKQWKCSERDHHNEKFGPRPDSAPLCSAIGIEGQHQKQNNQGPLDHHRLRLAVNSDMGVRRNVKDVGGDCGACVGVSSGTINPFPAFTKSISFWRGPCLNEAAIEALCSILNLFPIDAGLCEAEFGQLGVAQKYPAKVRHDIFSDTDIGGGLADLCARAATFQTVSLAQFSRHLD
jgi:hypothetical protein